MHEYETIFIIQPSLTDEETETLAKVFEGVVAEHRPR